MRQADLPDMSRLTKLFERIQDHSWLVIGSNHSQIMTQDVIHKFLFVDKNIFEIRCFCPNISEPWTPVLNAYVPGKGLVFDKLDMLSKCEHPLKGKSLRVGYRLAIPASYIDEKTGEATGYDFDLARVFAEKFGFQIEFVRAEFEAFDQAKGNYNKNSSTYKVNAQKLEHSKALICCLTLAPSQ